MQRIAQKDYQYLERKREREREGKEGGKSDGIFWDPGYSWAWNYFILRLLNYYANYQSSSFIFFASTHLNDVFLAGIQKDPNTE